MTHLSALNKYFVRYKWRLLLGIVFVIMSNLLVVLTPKIVRIIIDEVQQNLLMYNLLGNSSLRTDFESYIFRFILWDGLLLLLLALLRGIFMFFMRQTLIVMSRHIEYDQKNEIYNHYQVLDTQFFKTHYTGDLMNRLAEDVSRVRMYTGPSIMYATNVLVLTVMSVWYMLQVNVKLTLYVIAPLPLLAISIYFVNRIIYKKSGKIQAQLSDLTTTAQESYSGIRVIKSFVQENNMLRFFQKNSEAYRNSSINLALTEAIYFPSMTLFIGISTLLVVFIGGELAMQGQISVGNIAEFVMYVIMLMFPISSIGSVASMVQRASASQRRINEFLDTRPQIISPEHVSAHQLQGGVSLRDVTFVYPHTGIKALQHFSLNISPGQKIAIIGKTGSGKSTLTHLLLRMYDPTEGEVLLDNISIKEFKLQQLRKQIGYAPQEAFLFSDTIFNNIKFGRNDATEADVKEAARLADLDKEIATFANGYDTMIGERGVMLSGGQKQRMVLARALLKNSKLLILDECLSAVDTRTEQTILGNLKTYVTDKTTIVITHRIFTTWTFDQIIVLDNGTIAEHGTHETLMQLDGRYAKLYRHQTLANS